MTSDRITRPTPKVTLRPREKQTNRAEDTEPLKTQGVTANLQVLDNAAGQQL